MLSYCCGGSTFIAAFNVACASKAVVPSIRIALLQLWMIFSNRAQEDGEKTVVLKSEGPDLPALEAKAQSLLLPTFLVEDAG